MRHAIAGVFYWECLDILTTLWRSITTIAIVQKSKSPEVPIIYRQIVKTHQAIIQAMNPEQKVEFFTNRLVFPKLLLNEEVVDGNTAWISRSIELVTPYLRDENE